MSNFKKGDKVRSSFGAERIVEAVSSDGTHLWLTGVRGTGYFTVFSEDWTLVPSFFEEGKRYRRHSTGSIFVAEKVTDRGQLRAYLLRVDGEAGILAYEAEFENFGLMDEF